MLDDIKPISDKKCTPNIENGDQILRDICFKKAESIYGKDMPERIKNRLEKELRIYNIKWLFSTLFTSTNAS